MDERWQNTLERFRAQKAAMGQETPVEVTKAEPAPARDWRATGLEWALEAADYQDLLGFAALADELKRARSKHEAAAHRYQTERQQGRRHAFGLQVNLLAAEGWVIRVTKELQSKVGAAVGGELPAAGASEAFVDVALEVFRRAEAEFAPSLG